MKTYTHPDWYKAHMIDRNIFSISRPLTPQHIASFVSPIVTEQELLDFWFIEDKQEEEKKREYWDKSTWTHVVSNISFDDLMDRVDKVKSEIYNETDHILNVLVADWFYKIPRSKDEIKDVIIRSLKTFI